MKKYLITAFFLLILILPKNGFCQVVVSDPTMLDATIANWAKQLENAEKQFNKIKDQADMLKEGIDIYKKVNKTIKNGKRVKSLIDRQISLINLLSSELGNTSKDIINLDAHEAYLRRLNNILEASKNNVIALTEILTDSKLNLSDYERLRMIDDLEQKSIALYDNAQYEKKKYDKLNTTLNEIERLTNKK